MRKILLLLMPLLCSAKNLTLESRINPPARELMDVEIVGDIMMIPGNLDGYDIHGKTNFINKFIQILQNPLLTFSPKPERKTLGQNKKGYLDW